MGFNSGISMVFQHISTNFNVFQHISTHFHGISTHFNQLLALCQVNEKPFEDLKHCTAALTRVLWQWRVHGTGKILPSLQLNPINVYIDNISM
jgi:hypothetical protein